MTGSLLQAKVNTNDDAVSLYPNPASAGRFTILLPEVSENTVVRIYDNQGKILYEKIACSGNKIEINSRLGAGFYLVTIYSKTFNFTKKLIVQ